MTRQSLIDYKVDVEEVMDLMKEGLPLVIFDTETTGLNKKLDRILSFSAIKVVMTADGFKEIGRIDQFIDPGVEIPEEVSAINHITAATVAGCPDEYEGAEIIRNFVGENPLVGGYNSSSFDEPIVNAMYLRVFGEEFTPCAHLDILKMAREKLDMPSHKLGLVAHELGADVGLEFHNSIDDVIATFRCMKILLDMYKSEPEEIPVCKRQVTALSAKRWTRSHDQDRIYISTRPYSKTYYDVYRKVWISDIDDLDVDDLKRQVFVRTKCANEAEMAKVIA